MEGERICGVHPVYEAVFSSRVIERIHVARGAMPDKIHQVLDRARARNIPVRRESRQMLDRLARGEVHQGIVAIAGGYRYRPLSQLLEAGPPGSEPLLLVVLDQVQDPQNLGAVIRTAETAGAGGLVVTERHSAPLSAAVARASAGAIEHLPIARVPNLASALKLMKQNGIWLVGLDPDAESGWTAFDYTVPVALVLGGEHGGIRRLVREQCDTLVRLPVRGRVASLNVSVAAGIALYEVVRQRIMRRALSDEDKH